MADLSVKIAGVEFPNPVIAASGTYGNGECFTDLYPLSRLGGISCKGMTIVPKMGNVPPRIAETPSGILNSVGLQNIGVHGFIEYYLPTLKEEGNVIIANVAGATIDDYIAAAEALDVTSVDMIELNISCPNVKEGGIVFGTVPEAAAEVVRAVKANTGKMVIAKLSPNVTDIVVMAKAVEAAGADAISMINTLLGTKIDIERQRPVLGNVTGGLSGPAVRPVAVRLVYQVAQAVHIPIIGMGGIMCAEDAIEFMLAGASAVAVGTANFVQPDIAETIAHGMLAYLDRHNAQNISEIVGLALPNGKASMPLYNDAV